MANMTRVANRGERRGPVDSLQQLAAEAVARQIDFRSDEHVGHVHGSIRGDPLLYSRAVSDPRTIDALKAGRSTAVSRMRNRAQRFADDGQWYHTADTLLQYHRPAGHAPQLENYQRMRQVVTDDVTMDRFVRMPREAPDPGNPLSHLMFPDERWGMGRPSVYPPEFFSFVMERLGYPDSEGWHPDRWLWIRGQIRQRYNLTAAQAQVVLQEMYRDFRAGHSP